MKGFKNKVIWVLLFLLTFNLIPYANITKVKATDDINIISTTEITVSTAKEWAKSKGATETFINLADLYWKYSSKNGNVNPAVAYVQAAKETGYGKFGGVINESYNNPCGLKTSQGGEDTDPDAHMKFKSWDEGVQAHLDHLALYAGASGYPRSNTYDPRHFASILGKAKTVQALGGNWAPSTSYGSEIKSMYNVLLTNQSNEAGSKKITVIDTPTSGLNTSEDILKVSGWALNSKQVSKVNVYLDGNFQTTAQIGLSRPDVANVYPSYGNSNSGYTATINIGGLSDGIKTIRVEQVGKDNSKDSVEVKIKITKHKPIQVIDTPRNNSNITGNSMNISGWSLNGIDIKQINLYVDGKSKGVAKMGDSRPDVAKVYPQYTNAATSGYHAQVDISDIAGGNRIVKVEQVARDGTKHVSEVKVYINKPTPITVIDTPVSGANVETNTLRVSGWALNSNGVKEIKIYLDGQLKATTKTGGARPDVAKVYPQYNTMNSGYGANIDITNVANGQKKLVVEQVASNNDISRSEVMVNIKKPTPITVIDSPGNNAKVGNTISVSGWALNSKGVKAINVYIDGKLMTTTRTQFSRPDVRNVYPAYQDSNSGYLASVNLKEIKGGNRTLKVEQVGNDGSIDSVSRVIYVNKDVPKTVIDSPANGMKITSKQLDVSGWALNPAGIKEVKVYVNNTEMTTVSTGLPRQDVANVYPSYGDSKSGYRATININAIKAGNNTITVKQFGNDGTVDSVSTTINISKKSSVTVIDVPSSDMVVNDNSIRVSGWALNDSGVKQVNVYIDNVKVGSPAINISRADVISAYPGYQTSSVCGFAINVDLSKLSKGQHKVVIEAVGYDGSVNRASNTFYYKDKPSKLIVLDPGHNNGGDDGAYATVNGVTYSERELNGVIALKVKKELEDKGYRVLLTRNPLVAEYLSLNESLARRVNLANSLNADLFISIHQNKFELESANGTEVFYSTNNPDSPYETTSDKNTKVSVSKALAAKLSSNISSEAGFRNRGAKQGNLFVCRNTTMPSVLIECGFISNAGDVAKLNSPSGQAAIARAIASGVKNVIG